MARWIKNDANFDFVGKFKFFATLSSLAVGGSLLAMLVNVFVRGDAFNYSTDFKGGTEIQVEFSKSFQAQEIRGALQNAGHAGAEVVRVTDARRANFFMIRLSTVSAFSAKEEKAVNDVINAKFKQENVRRFEHKDGSDKIYLHFKRDFKVTPEDIQVAFKSVNVDAQQIQRYGRPIDNVYEISIAGLDREIRNTFERTLGQGSVTDVPQVEAVGAKMGAQLRLDAIKAMIYCMLLIMVYIAFRFDFHYAPGAVIALAHDAIITAGIFAVTWQEFSINVVAALLTIVGFSINDTIVVYDRIRENVARLRDRKLRQIVNQSVNETMSRTILTSLTVLITSASVWIVGTSVLRGFASAMTIGVVVGTYSSIYIASPFTIMLKDMIGKRKAAA